MAMEEEEGASVLAGVFLVELFDALRGEECERVGIFVKRAGFDIGKIGEEAEVDVGVLI